MVHFLHLNDFGLKVLAQVIRLKQPFTSLGTKNVFGVNVIYWFIFTILGPQQMKPFLCQPAIFCEAALKRIP